VTDIEKTFALLDAAERRQREEVKRQATPEPVTPEDRHERFAEELATRLRDAQSTWTTFDGKAA
jgi:hypothetical protein